MITYQERAELAQDVIFRGRVKIACLTYADYITIQINQMLPGQNSWAAEAIAQPDVMSMKVSQLVVNDAKVIAAGKEITDADLQSATESTVNKWM